MIIKRVNDNDLMWQIKEKKSENSSVLLFTQKFIVLFLTKEMQFYDYKYNPICKKISAEEDCLF